MDKINGNYICGLKGGTAFKDIVRVDSETNYCPIGMVVCSHLTSPVNTQCVEDRKLCPITEIKFVDNPEDIQSTSTFERQKYIFRRFNEIYIAFSIDHD